MPEQESGMPPEGWYNDLTGVAQFRWWDGQRWTEDTHGVAGTSAQPTASAPVADQAAASAFIGDAGTLTRRQLREQVGSLTVGVPDEAEPRAAVAVAVLERHYPELVHSPFVDDNLDPLERARRAAGYGPRAIMAAPPPAVEEERWRGSAQTVAGWFFATALLWSGIPGAVVAALMPTWDLRAVQLGSLAVIVLFTLLLAHWDGKRLRAKGYRAVGVGWALLPLIYFIIRVVRTGPRGIGMLVTWVVLLAMTVGAALVVGEQQHLFDRLGQVAAPQTSAASSPLVTQLPAPHVLSDDERAQALSPGVFQQAVLDAITTSGHEAGDILCEPFTTTSTGTFAGCNVVIDGQPYSMILRETPEDPEYAFAIDSLTPWTQPGGGSTDDGTAVQS